MNFDRFEYAVFGAGNPILDISCVVKCEFLKKYDINVDNAILAEEKHLPMYEEMSHMSGVVFVPGGSTLNTIRVCQWMLQKSGKTSYIGCIGDDTYGKKMQDGCNVSGVQTNFMKSEKSTGTCAVPIHEKERALVANLSAANDYKIIHLNESCSIALWQHAKICYSAGFFLTVCPEGMIKIAKFCQQNGRPYCLNISAVFIPQFFKDPMIKIFPYVTHIFGNKAEAQALSKNLNFGTNDVIEIAQKLSIYLGKRTVVITQSSEPVIVVTESDTQTFDVPLLEKEKIVDSNGAGDAFLGGFLSQMALDASLKKCVQAGNYAARKIIQTSGCLLSGTPSFQ